MTHLRVRAAFCALAIGLLALPSPTVAASVAPPCGGVMASAPAATGEPPLVAVLRGADRDAAAAACPRLRTAHPALLVTVAGRFAAPIDRDALLARFGAISRQRAIRYWSITDSRWQALVTGADALSGPNRTLRRADFTVAELIAGRDLYFAQQDNRSSAPVIYRMRVRDVTPRGFLVETENVSPVRYLVMQIYGIGDLHTLFFLERTDDGVWNYFSVNEIGSESRLFAAPDRSYVNRAVALFRFFAGIPTDREPPAAR